MGLREAWESEAANWVAWARKPGHDSYWTFHRDAFLELLPAPRGLTLDIGCGEGRLPVASGPTGTRCWASMRPPP